MWEMKGIASALKRSDNFLDQSVLYLIDEVGRGTSIDDGASYSFAIAEELALRRYCFTIFATHFDQVFALTTLYGNVNAYHFKYEDELDVTPDGDKRLKITHELIPGLAEINRYGLKLAEACGIPQEILRAAYSSEL
jgi:DNA mismatch repair protein MSH2